MPRVGFPRSPQDTRKTQDTPIPAVLGKTLTDYLTDYRLLPKFSVFVIFSFDFS